MKKFYLFILVFIISLGVIPSQICAAEDASPAAYMNYLKARLLIDEGKYAEAKDELTKVIAAEPSTPEPWRDLAIVYISIGQTQKALETADEIARRFPDDKESIKFLADLYTQLNSYKQAAYYYEKLLESEPDNDTALIYLANYYYLINPQEAIKYLQRLSSQHPSNAQVFTKLAEIYEKLKFYDDAIKNYRKSMELASDEKPAEIHLALSRIYEILKDTASAISEYEAYLAEDPNNPTIIAYLGTLYFYTGDIEKSRRSFEHLVEISSSDPQMASSARIWLGTLYADEGKIQSAISQFEKAASITPAPAIYKYLAELNLRQRKPQEALKMLDNVTRLTPSDYYAYFMKGLIFIDIKNFSKAIRELTASLKIKPDFEDALFYRAVSYDNIKNSKLMRQDFEKLLAINPRHHQGANYLAYSLADKGIELDTAMRLITKALEEEPENPAYLDTLAWIYYKKKNLAEAEKILDRTTKILKSDWEILYHTAIVKEEIAYSSLAADKDHTIKNDKLRQAANYYRLSLFCEPPDGKKRLEIKNRLDKIEKSSDIPGFATENIKNFASTIYEFSNPPDKIPISTSVALTADYMMKIIRTSLKIPGNLTTSFTEKKSSLIRLDIAITPIMIKIDDHGVTFIPSLLNLDEKVYHILQKTLTTLNEILHGNEYNKLQSANFNYSSDGLPVKLYLLDETKITFSPYTLDINSIENNDIKMVLDDYIFLSYKNYLKRLPRKIILYTNKGKNKIFEITITNFKFTTQENSTANTKIFDEETP